MNTSGLPPFCRPVQKLLEELERGELTSLELVGNLLERIEKHDSALGAFIDVYGEEACKAADSADLARSCGHAVGPLHGIPVAIKDIIDIEGKITTDGSKV